MSMDRHVPAEEPSTGEDVRRSGAEETRSVTSANLKQQSSFHIPLLRRMPTDRQHSTHFPSYFTGSQKLQSAPEEHVRKHGEDITKFMTQVYSELGAPSSSSSSAPTVAATSLSGAKGYVNKELVYSYFFDRPFLYDTRNEFAIVMARTLGVTATDAASLNRLLLMHEEVHLSSAVLLSVLARRIADPAVCRQLLYRMDPMDTGKTTFVMFVNFLLSLQADEAFYHSTHSPKIEPDFSQDNVFGHVHTNPIANLVDVSYPRRMLVTASTDTVIKFWDLGSSVGSKKEPLLLGTAQHENKNSAMLSGMLEAMDRDQRSKYIQKAGTAKLPKGRNVVLSITSVAALPLSPHIIVASSDCCITLYETTGRSACGRVTDLEDVPTAVACFYESLARAGPGGGHTLHQRVAFGDSLGYLRIIELPHDFNNSLETGSKRKSRALFEAALGSKTSYYRTRIHNTWINKMAYIPDLRSLFTAASSPDYSISIIDFIFSASAPISSRVAYYRGHCQHRSVACAFSYSALTKHMVSAGGRVVLVWDPHSLQTLFTIEGSTAPVVGMQVSDEDRRIYVCQRDKIVRLYNVETLELVQSAADHTSYSPLDELSAMVHLSHPSRLVTAGNRMSVWSVSREGLQTGRKSKEDLAASLYSAVFLVIVTVTNLGGVGVYDVRTGALVRRFDVGFMSNMGKGARGAAEGAGPALGQGRKQSLGDVGSAVPCVASACLDQKQLLLLLVTRTGYFQAWNFHCGECLFSVVPSLPSLHLQATAGDRESASSTVACLLHKVGLFGFHRKSLQKCLLVGGRNGTVAALREKDSGIDPTPCATLKRPHSASGLPCESSVLWMEPVMEDRVAVGYADGCVFVWSTVTDAVSAEVRVGGAQGLLLRCVPRGGEPPAEEVAAAEGTSGAPVTAACCVFVSRAQVLILACSDALFRIVDVSTGLVQGSLCYDNRRSGAVMQRLALSRAEDVLVGVLSDFTIKIWGVHQQAFKLLATAVTRAVHVAYDASAGYAIANKAASTAAAMSVEQQQDRNASTEQRLQEHASSMATSPLQEVSSFAGVQSPAVSLVFSTSFCHCDADVVADAGKKDVVDSYSTDALRDDHVPVGFIICASVNEQVALWRSDGRLVGTCGSDKYDVDVEATFVADEREVIDSKELTDSVAGSLSPRPPQASLRSSAGAGRVMTLSYKDKRHSSAELNRYVGRLQHEAAVKSKVPGSDYMNRHYSNLVVNHPVDFSAGDFDYRAFMRERNIVAKSEGL